MLCKSFGAIHKGRLRRVRLNDNFPLALHERVTNPWLILSPIRSPVTKDLHMIANEQRMNKFRDFRHEMGDVLKDCCRVVLHMLDGENVARAQGHITQFLWG
jgi:hypothetical protein